MPILYLCRVNRKFQHVSCSCICFATGQKSCPHADKSIDAALNFVQPLRITLKGVTNHDSDPSVDTWRTVSLPLLRHILGHEDLDELQLKVLSRGCSPLVRPSLFTKSLPFAPCLPQSLAGRCLLGHPQTSCCSIKGSADIFDDCWHKLSKLAWLQGQSPLLGSLVVMFLAERFMLGLLHLSRQLLWRIDDSLLWCTVKRIWTNSQNI